MDTWAIILVLGAACGPIMVLGGIFLLYKGAISLTNISGADAFTIEYKKELRISTQYPAIAIFAIGLSFTWLSLVVGKSEIKQIKILATTKDMSESVKVSFKGKAWSSDTPHTGEIIETISSNLDQIQVVFSAPGYESILKTLVISEIKNGVANLGDLNLPQKLTKPPIDSSRVVPIPEGLPSLNDKPAFGEIR